MPADVLEDRRQKRCPKSQQSGLGLSALQHLTNASPPLTELQAVRCLSDGKGSSFILTLPNWWQQRLWGAVCSSCLNHSIERYEEKEKMETCTGSDNDKWRKEEKNRKNWTEIFRDWNLPSQAAVRKAALFKFTFSPVLLRAFFKKRISLNA